MTISKDKTEKQKDIDDVLSSIDSLLDTATEVETDDLPMLEIENESEPKASEPDEKIEKLVLPKKPTINKKKSSNKISAKSTKVSNKRPIKKDSVTSTSKKQKENQPVTEKITETGHKTKTESQAEKKTTPKLKAADTPKQPKSTLNFSTVQTDFSLTQKELPVLDEIITDEEMALIAAGKELPKRVITEKFIPKTTADKIIDVMAIQLADYNITRLEYEYLHELIDEILEEEKNKKP